jgi:hypothetical protein
MNHEVILHRVTTCSAFTSSTLEGEIYGEYTLVFFSQSMGSDMYPDRPS